MRKADCALRPLARASDLYGKTMQNSRSTVADLMGLPKFYDKFIPPFFMIMIKSIVHLNATIMQQPYADKNAFFFSVFRMK